MRSLFLCGFLLSALAFVNGKHEFEPHGLDAKSLEQFRKDFLDAHNKYRTKHGVPAMKLNETLNSDAQIWAERLLRHNRLGHPGSILNVWHIEDKTFGRNGLDGARPVDDWYNKYSKNYKWYGSKPDMELIQSFRPFTHLVWKENTDLGVGIAHLRDDTLVIGQYHPLRYVPASPEKYAENVLAPIV